MDELVIVYKIQKRIQSTLQQIGDVMISGGVDNYEKYKYLLGQAQAYQLILQEISNLLKDKEQPDEQPDTTNVVEFGDRGTEN
jgi:Zn-dependent membrane protease YugP